LFQGEKSEFLGGTFLVETKADLERASQTLPEASELQPAGPAGGFLVTFRDPDGILGNLVWGLDAKPIKTDDTVPVVNFPIEKPRKGEFRR